MKWPSKEGWFAIGTIALLVLIGVLAALQVSKDTKEKNKRNDVQTHEHGFYGNDLTPDAEGSPSQRRAYWAMEEQADKTRLLLARKELLHRQVGNCPSPVTQPCTMTWEALASHWVTGKRVAKLVRDVDKRVVAEVICLDKDEHDPVPFCMADIDNRPFTPKYDSLEATMKAIDEELK